METRILLTALALVGVLAIAGCTQQEVEVPLPDPDDVDVPDVDVPDVDADVDVPDVEQTGQGDVDIEAPDVVQQGRWNIEIPEYDLVGGDFDIEWPEYDLVGGNWSWDWSTTEDEGRVIFAVTSNQSDFERVSSVFVDFDGTHIHGADGDWEEVWMWEERVDLLELGAEERTSTISDDEETAGNYDAIRIDVAESTIDDHLGRADAVLPSEEWFIPVDFSVERNQTTVIVLDINAEQSVRLADRGSQDERYVFAPVMEVRVYENAQVEEGGEDDTIRVMGQPTVATRTVGMDADGEIVAGIPIGWDYELSVDAETEEVTVEVPTAEIEGDFDADHNVRG